MHAKQAGPAFARAGSRGGCRAGLAKKKQSSAGVLRGAWDVSAEILRLAVLSQGQSL